MANSRFRASPQIPPDLDTIHQVCRKCKKLLPIDCYMKNGLALKACFECRNSHQIKKRAGRRQLAEINAQLRYNPTLSRMVLENSDREACMPTKLPSNPPHLSTTTLSSTIELERHFTSTPASNPVAPDTEKELSPVRGKSAILVAAESMRKALDTIVFLVKKGSCTNSRQPSTETSSHNSMELRENLIKSESSVSKYEPSDDSGSEISGPSHFVCMHCVKARSIGLRYDDICMYCFEKKQQFCVPGDHEIDENEFFDEDGNEYDACNECREVMVNIETEINIEIE